MMTTTMRGRGSRAREESNYAEKVDRGDQTGDSLLLLVPELSAASERESPSKSHALLIGNCPKSHGAFEIQLD